jgi:hypothetical protein
MGITKMTKWQSDAGAEPGSRTCGKRMASSSIYAEIDDEVL